MGAMRPSSGGLTFGRQAAHVATAEGLLPSSTRPAPSTVGTIAGGLAYPASSWRSDLERAAISRRTSTHIRFRNRTRSGPTTPSVAGEGRGQCELSHKCNASCGGWLLRARATDVRPTLRVVINIRAAPKHHNHLAPPVHDMKIQDPRTCADNGGVPTATHFNKKTPDNAGKCGVDMRRTL